MLVFTRDLNLKMLIDTAASLNRDKASHFEVFPTLLYLFGYDPTAVRDRYHANLFEAITEPMGVTTGSLTGPLISRLRWIERDELDILKR